MILHTRLWLNIIFIAVYFSKCIRKSKFWKIISLPSSCRPFAVYIGFRLQQSSDKVLFTDWQKYKYELFLSVIGIVFSSQIFRIIHVENQYIWLLPKAYDLKLWNDIINNTSLVVLIFGHHPDHIVIWKWIHYYFNTRFRLFTGKFTQACSIGHDQAIGCDLFLIQMLTILFTGTNHKP